MKMSPPPTMNLEFKSPKCRLKEKKKETEQNLNFTGLRVLIDQLDAMKIYLEGPFLQFSSTLLIALELLSYRCSCDQ